MTIVPDAANARRAEHCDRHPLLQVRGLTKRFGGLVAANAISFDVGAGEIVGLIGPNGSGKSTAMKLIMGIEQADAGSVKLAGVEMIGLPSYKIARAGIGLVFQHSRPLHRQTVLENIQLGLLPDSFLQVFPAPEIVAQARAIAVRVGLEKVLDRHPASLPFADLRKLELAKAIARNPRVILVDEPFAGLTVTEAHKFSDLIRGFRDEGRAVLLVDHNVKSVAALVDRAIALYLGEIIAEGRAEEVISDAIVRRVYMGGAIGQHTARDRGGAHAKVLLEVDGLTVHYGKAQALEGVSLHVGEGEFVSVVGLNGAGKTTLFNAISGIVPYSGEISCSQATLRGKSAAGIARTGIVQCPETRELFRDMSVRENLDLGGYRLGKPEATRRLAWLFDLFPILSERSKQDAGTLSGGEQQMLAIARSLMSDPKLLMLDEPTLGLAPIILEQLSRTIEKLRETTPITFLLGEQNVTFALPHADRVYVLEHARIVWEGPPERFADELGETYL